MKETAIGGIFIAPIAGDLVVAIFIYLLVRRFLLAAEVERRVWHPQLFNLCVFVIILCLLALL